MRLSLLRSHGDAERPPPRVVVLVVAVIIAQLPSGVAQGRCPPLPRASARLGHGMPQGEGKGPLHICGGRLRPGGYAARS